MPTTADVARIKETLVAAGWRDAVAGYAEAGIEVQGFGELALQYENKAAATLLRLEFHREGPDGVPELHLHVTDADDVGPDFVLRPAGSMDEVVGVLVAVQDELTVETINDGPIAKLLDVCPSMYFVHDRRLRTIRPSAEATAAFEEGVEHADAGRLAEAAQAFGRTLELCGDHEGAAHGLTQVARISGDYAAMLRGAERWCALVGEDEAEPWLLLSIALQQVGRRGDALEVIEVALAIDETNGNHHYQHACLLALEGRRDESVAAVALALECEPELAAEMAEDDDLRSLRGMTEFDALVTAYAD